VSTRADAAAVDEILAQRRAVPLAHIVERGAPEWDAPESDPLVTDLDVAVPAARERGPASREQPEPAAGTAGVNRVDAPASEGRELHEGWAGASREQRFAELYQAYWAHTVRFIEHRLRAADQGWAEDLAQSTFARAWPYVDRVELADDGTLYRWLSTIARHAVCDHYAKGFGRQRAAEVPLAPDAPLWHSGAVLDDSAATDAVEAQTDLTAALEQLPTEIRQAVQQRVVEELPWAVVAQRMRHGKAMVRRLVDEGLDSLRNRMVDHSAAIDAAPDPLDHARRAVAEVSRRRAEHQRQAGERARAAQLARWHTDDHTTTDSTRGLGEVAR
jgi:RNA polymerase sigma factor (sigma-70 family)